jgi:hypothetical protein
VIWWVYLATLRPAGVAARPGPSDRVVVGGAN